MIDAQAPTLLEAAKARAASLETHGPSIQVGNIHYYEKSFKGTAQDIEGLVKLQNDSAFQEKYPNRCVFALGSEVIGALPRGVAFDSSDYKSAVIALQQESAVRGITLFNCAIIKTGPQQVEKLSF